MSKIAWTEQTWKLEEFQELLRVREWPEEMAWSLATMDVSGYRSVVDCLAPDYSPRWKGKTEFVGSAISKPLRRQKPTMYFVCSMGDLFHESVPDEWIDRVFATMAKCPQHTFQVLTKRAARMEEYIKGLATIGGAIRHEGLHGGEYDERRHKTVMIYRTGRHLPNVWLGVTAENQEQADKRIPHLLSTPAAVRFVSVEPMLGPIDIARYLSCQGCGTRLRKNLPATARDCCPDGTNSIDWLICGCESGPERRPMELAWAHDLLDQCKEDGVPFFIKQLSKDDSTGMASVTRKLEEFPKLLRVREWPEVMQ